MAQARSLGGRAGVGEGVFGQQLEGKGTRGKGGLSRGGSGPFSGSWCKGERVLGLEKE